MRSYVVQANKVTKRYGSVSALEDVSLELASHEVVGLIGPSGAGKTTLLRCLDLLVPVDSGRLTYCFGLAPALTIDGTETDPDLATVIRRSIGYVFQRLHLWPERTVLDNLSLAPRVVHREAAASIRQRAESLADDFEIRTLLERRVWELSGGEQQRVAIVRALMMQPQLLLLDEITSSLDPLLVNSVMGTIRDLKSRSTAMLLVTHHLDFAASVCDRVAFMDAGRILQVGTPSDVIQNPCSEEVARFLTVLRQVR